MPALPGAEIEAQGLLQVFRHAESHPIKHRQGERSEAITGLVRRGILRGCFGIALRRIQDAAIEILIARPRRLALGGLLANGERLIDLYVFEGDAVADPLRVLRLVRQLVALQRNGIVAIGRKVEAGLPAACAAAVWPPRRAVGCEVGY